METQRIRRPNHVLADWGALKRHLLVQIGIKEELLRGQFDDYLQGSLDTLRDTLLIMEKMDDQDKE